MFVIISLQKIGGQYNEKLVEINGLSTDEKPLKKIGNILIKNGSTFLEIDTGKKYKFDSENKKWYEVDSKIISSGGEYQAKAHNHDNKEVLDNITSEKVSAWDAAQANIIENVTSNSLNVGTITDKSIAIDITWGEF